MANLFIENVVLNLSRAVVVLPKDCNTILSITVIPENVPEMLAVFEVEGKHYHVIGRQGIERGKQISLNNTKQPINARITNKHMRVAIKTHTTMLEPQKWLKIICEYE